MELIFASNNSNKVAEINNILGNSFVLKGLKDTGITEDIPETTPTLEGNALQKAKYVFERTGMDVFADDTGLEVDTLDGLPGVHSARFAGDDKNSDANIDKLLSLLDGKENRKARFRTVIALIIGGEEFLFEGSVDGTIISERRGGEGFGYDPVFVPVGFKTTFAEMPLNEKNKISHRARAFEELRKFLMNRNISS